MDQTALKEWLHEPRLKLTEAIVAGLEQHLKSLETAEQPFYGYSILLGKRFSPGELVGVTNREADLEVEADDPMYTYYRYNVDEWQQWDHEQFTAANRLLAALDLEFKSKHQRQGNEFIFDEIEHLYADLILEAILQGMVAAKAQGLFGKDERFLVIWIAGSPGEITMQSLKTLNSPKVVKAFIEEFGEDF